VGDAGAGFGGGAGGGAGVAEEVEDVDLAAGGFGGCSGKRPVCLKEVGWILKVRAP
jgi:hypothetical protein